MLRYVDFKGIISLLLTPNRTIIGGGNRSSLAGEVLCGSSYTVPGIILRN